MKILKWILLIVGIVLIALIGYGVYAFTQIKSPTQKDLGVKYTIADYNQAVIDKAKVEVPVPGALYLGSTFLAQGSQQVEHDRRSGIFQRAVCHRRHSSFGSPGCKGRNWRGYSFYFFNNYYFRQLGCFRGH